MLGSILGSPYFGKLLHTGCQGVPKDRHPTKDPLKAMVRELRGFLEGLSDPGLPGVHLTPGRYTRKQRRAGSLGHGRSFELTGVTTTFHPIKHNSYSSYNGYQIAILDPYLNSVFYTEHSPKLKNPMRPL